MEPYRIRTWIDVDITNYRSNYKVRVLAEIPDFRFRQWLRLKYQEYYIIYGIYSPFVCWIKRYDSPVYVKFRKGYFIGYYPCINDLFDGFDSSVNVINFYFTTQLHAMLFQEEIMPLLENLLLEEAEKYREQLTKQMEAVKNLSP